MDGIEDEKTTRKEGGRQEPHRPYPKNVGNLDDKGIQDEDECKKRRRERRGRQRNEKKSSTAQKMLQT